MVNMTKYIVLCCLLICMIVLCKGLALESPGSHRITTGNDTLTTSSKAEVRKRHARDEPEDCDIVFPDKTSVKGTFSTKRCRPTTYSAKGKGRKCIDGVCGDAVDYPFEQMERIRHKLNSYNNLFGNLDGVKIFAQRAGEPEPMSLCSAAVHTIYPKTLKNDKDVEKFIVNVEGHTQGLLLETCNEKATCMFSSLFPNTYTSQCTQKYATRRLMALNEDGNPAFDSFVVPSCCLCMIKHVKS